MHTVDLIAKSLGKQDVPPNAAINICAVTGEQCLCVPRKELLGKSFTNGDILSAPGSLYVGLNAYVALTYKWERMASWYCDGAAFVRLDRKSVREMVLKAEYGASWSGYATTSYKKHGSLFTKINSRSQAVWRFEMLNADCSDTDSMLIIWDRLNLELRAGIWRSILETLICPPFVLKQIGVGRWINFERWARPLYQGGLYRFLCYLLPSKEELKNEHID